jgi:hypothetical protein
VEGHELRLDVIYPAVDTPCPSAGYWRTRLLPNIVFEDSKAIQKLDKTFRLIGLRSFKFFNLTDLPDDLMYHNRVWLCLPRNAAAQKALRKYQTRCHFQMSPETDGMPGEIRWQPREATTFTRAVSPLSSYLKLQRTAANGNEPMNWSREFRNIIAKDYGIIARFSVDSSIPTTDGTLKEYFIAGIRGLGTWGASWFIDRRYQIFDNVELHADIQILVEVTYADGRIQDVRDVSNEAQSYFDDQIREDKIREIVAAYHTSAQRGG